MHILEFMIVTIHASRWLPVSVSLGETVPHSGRGSRLGDFPLPDEIQSDGTVHQHAPPSTSAGLNYVAQQQL